MKYRETGVQASIKAHMEDRGCVVLRRNAGAGAVPDGRGGFRPLQAGETGESDLIVCVPPDGIFLAAEIKRAAIKGYCRAGKSTEKQREFLMRVRIAGGSGEVIRTIGEADIVLDALGCPKLGGSR